MKKLEKRLKRKSVKELIEIARVMNIEWLIVKPRSNNGNDNYTDYVTVSKNLLIDRIINKRSFNMFKQFWIGLYKI